MKASKLPLAIFASLLLALPQMSAVAGTETAMVLIDFGDGSYVWEDVELGVNRTAFNATVTATNQANLTLEYTWFAFGVMVNDIGDRNPSYPAWWHFYLWNGTIGRWEMASVGATDVMLGNGDAMAWYLAVDGPSSKSSPTPTPASPYPSMFARGDLPNSGRYQGLLCSEYRSGWAYDTGSFEISGTPAASNGIVYVPTWTGLFALDAKSGGLVWRRDDIRGMSSPAVIGGDLFIGGNDGKLRRLSAATGAEIWSTTLSVQPVFTGIASSPKPFMDRVYVGLFNETGGTGGVAALDFWNGSVIWRHDSPSVHMSSPAIGDTTLFVGVAGFFDNSTNSFDAPHGLLALDSATGAQKWFFLTSGPVMSSPTILDYKIYFTSRDGRLHALWLYGAEAWNRRILPSTSSPATDGDRLFVGGGVLGGNGSVMAFSRDGDRLWVKEMAGPVQTSPLFADGLLFVGTNEARGTFYALNASDGDVIWEFTPSPEDYILSSPVVADGDLYLASDNGLVYQWACYRPGEGWGPLAYLAIIGGAFGLVALVEIVLRVSRRRAQ